MINYQTIGIQKLPKSISNTFFPKPFPAFHFKSSLKKLVFYVPKGASFGRSFGPRKPIFFFTVGFALHSGLVLPESNHPATHDPSLNPHPFCVSKKLQKPPFQRFTNKHFISQNFSKKTFVRF
jgi:hypothetical protein